MLRKTDKLLQSFSLFENYWLLSLVLALFLAVGCAGTKESKKSPDPFHHPKNLTSSTHKADGFHSGRKKSSWNLGSAPPKGDAIGIAGEQGSAIYKKAVIRVIDKVSDTSKLIQIPLGGTKVALEPDDEGIKIQAVRFFSDFALGQFGPHSRSDKLRNPALEVIITKGHEELFRGYLFSKYPEQHPFKHEVIKLILIDVLK